MFVKLYTQVLDSTVWREPNHVLRVFLTLLLVCDREGFVRISIPGLADRAKVSIPECEEAISRLESPDPYSQSREEDGARIIRVGDNGEPLWHLVNYEKYRAIKDQDQERERRRIKKARYRARKKEGPCLPTVYPMSTPCLPSVSPIVEGEAEAEAIKNTPPTPSERGERESKRFRLPTKAEVEEYIREKRYTFSADAFMDHYEANGWKRGRTPISDWRAACRTWEHRRKEEGKTDPKPAPAVRLL